MIITQTPLRIGLAGGGSDLPVFCRKEQGACINATIDKYVYVLVKKRHDDKIYLKYSENEVADNVDDIHHDFIKEALKFMEIDFGIEIINWADIPTKGTGLGSSSSFLVGLLNALHILKGRQVGPKRLAKEACYIEIEKCNKRIGFQDQFAAAFGGLNYMQFWQSPDATSVTSLNYADQQLLQLSENLMMFYTGITRSATDILSKESDHLENNGSQQFENMKMNVSIANNLFEKLSRGDQLAIGTTLKENWELKKTFSSKITNKLIDRMIEVAYNKGAVGCKITGAGGGGFLLIYAPMYWHNLIKNDILEISKSIKYMPIKIDRYGTRVLLNTEIYQWG
jgi:D-glycero-alpha-D-manno-heptose-7-phosphate kinase